MDVPTSGGALALTPPRARFTAVQRALLGVAALGILARLIVTSLSSGSNDVVLWDFFGQYLNTHGLRSAYVDLVTKPNMPVFNHPPLAAYAAQLSWSISQSTGIRYAALLKIPGLLGELVTFYALWKLWLRVSTTAAATAVAAYGLALGPILVTAFHGNTDGAPAGLMLLSVYLAQSKRPFSAGAALALAINIKIIPLIVIPAIFLSYRDRREALRFVGGLSLGVLPFLPFLFTIPQEFLRNIFGYSPGAELWGFQTFLLGAAQNPRLSRFAALVSPVYVGQFRVLLILVVLGAAAFARRRHWPLERAAVVPLAAFLILTPGFGVQYTVLVCPLLFAVSYRWGSLWAWLSGLFLFVVYFSYGHGGGGVPWGAILQGSYAPPASLIGVLAWASLIQFLMVMFLTTGKKAEPTLNALERPTSR